MHRPSQKKKNKQKQGWNPVGVLYQKLLISGVTSTVRVFRCLRRVKLSCCYFVLFLLLTKVSVIDSHC
jgi:hypothetical protein